VRSPCGVQSGQLPPVACAGLTAEEGADVDLHSDCLFACRAAIRCSHPFIFLV
jgi:hypothetical protein